MYILEGSDTQFTFHITEHSKSWQVSEVDLTVYDKVLMEVRYVNWIREYEWSLDNEENTSKNLHSYVSFELVWEATMWRAWTVKCDIWWVKDWQKVRFNFDTVIWVILPSVKVPQQWTAND